MATTARAKHGRFDSDDPYFYGYRDVERVKPDGSIVWDRIFLTEEDILHPQEDDHVTQNYPHGRRARYLTGVCERQLADDPSAVVLGDCQIAWDVRGLRPHGPDVAVILGVKARQAWSSFNVGTEGVRPSLIIEVTSPATVRNDLTTKVRQYARARVPQYVIVDGVVDRRPGLVRLLDYWLVGQRYVARPPDERGWVWLPVVKIWLGVVDGEMVCFDEAGRTIGDYTAEAARAEAEAAARAEAEARLRALEAELRRLRGQ